jgi:LacI family transcriptional regulator
MRGSGRISETTRDKVLQAAKEVNYLRDTQAAALRSGQFKEIGLLIHQIANPFNAEVVAGVSDKLESHGYLVFVLDMRDEAGRQRRYLETLLGGARGGLLWVPARETDQSTIDLVLAQRIPTVTFLRQLPNALFDHVGIENTAGTRDATRHLRDLGHRNIAFLGGSNDIDLRVQRVAGYKEIMAEEGMGPVVVADCEETKEGGMNAVQDLLRRNPDITGVVCNGDVVAMGATLGLTRIGKEAGKDISIIGFDGTEEAMLWTPKLSTMNVNAFSLGEQLAQTLIDRIANPDAPVRSTNLSAHLVARETTGPLAP